MKIKASPTGKKVIESNPKKSRQGNSGNTKLSASSKNGKRKKYRGQGR